MTLPTFIESPRFPSRIGWEYSVSIAYPVQIATRGVFESRNLDNEFPRRKIALRIPGDKEADINEITRWHHALRGRLIGFRMQDPSDHLSIDIHPYDGIGVTTYLNTTPLDQPIVPVVGSPDTYQLVKRYRLVVGLDALDQDLPIVKPVEGRIRIANDGGLEQDAALWDLDTETGIVTPATGFVGIPTTWGGEFDLPMRFDSDLPIEIRDTLMAEAIFELVELPREL